MKHTISKIDKALKMLYHLEVPFSANDFVLEVSPRGPECAPQASLLVQEDAGGLSLGIYFPPTIYASLTRQEGLTHPDWSVEELNVFATVTEEISHFLYLVFNAYQGRSVSQFDLELQGEIDKFLVLYFQDQQRN